MNAETRLTCKTCGMPVQTKDGVALRECDHEGHGILASVRATVTGKGGCVTSKEPDVAVP